MFKIVLNSVSY